MHQLGIQPRQPPKLSEAARLVADMVAGISRPLAGTPEAALQAALSGGAVEAAPEPRTFSRDELLRQLADDKSPAAVLMRDMVRAELARAKSESEGGE